MKNPRAERFRTHRATQQDSINQRGFALIATISIMVLLALLVVGLLSLSTVALRSSNAGSARKEAEVNARLALMLAIGELQRTLGNDRYISAPADVLGGDENQPNHYTGVWNARENPRDPNSDDALGKQPDYTSSNHFDGWLVSNGDRDSVRREDFIGSNSFDDPIEIVSEGGVGSNAEDRVFAGKVEVEVDNDRTGKYAWWVSENGTKAAVGLSDDLARTGLGMGDAMVAFGTPGVYGVESLEELDLEGNTLEMEKVASLGTLELATTAGGGTVGEEPVQEYFHDVTTLSRSLLVNPTSGGLRKDLSLFFEQEQSEDGRPWTGSILDGDEPLGPYGLAGLSPHRDPSGGSNEYDTGNWKQLWQHYSTYQTTRRDRGGLIGGRGDELVCVDDTETNSFRHPYPSWNYQRKLVKPVILRYSYVLSIGVQDVAQANFSQEDLQRIKNITPATRPFDETLNRYILTFHAYPVAAVWNPYNMKLECPGFAIGNMGMSVDHWVTTGGNRVQFQWGDVGQRDEAGWNVLGMSVPGPVDFEPGEVKMFFATEDHYRQGNNNQFYLRGVEVRDISRIAFDPGPLPATSRPFAAGLVKNGVIGDTRAGADGNQGVNTLVNKLIGLFVNQADVVTIESEIYTPTGNRNQGTRVDYDGLLYYGTYSSFDLRMLTKDMDRNSWKTDSLHWPRWGGGSSQPRASKWTNKIGWRNDIGSPIIPDQVPTTFVNVADLIGGRKVPFMALDLRLKATEDDPDQRNPNITWLHNIPEHGYAGTSGQTTSGVEVGNAGNQWSALHANPYTMVYRPAATPSEAWDALQFESIDGNIRTFMGNSFTPDGQHGAIASEIPMAPIQSLAQFQHVAQVPTDATRWSGLGLQNKAIGNSYPNPNLPSDEISSEGWRVWLDNRVDNADSRTNMNPDLDGVKWYTTTNGQGPATEHFKPTSHLDRSWVANTLLWDDFFFSGFSEYTGDLYRLARSTARDKEDVVRDFLARADPAEIAGQQELPRSVPNPRYLPYLGGRSSDEVANELLEEDGYRKAAAHLLVDGGFNVNSVSVRAWKTMLMSLLKRPMPLLSSRGDLMRTLPESDGDEYIISRYSLANNQPNPGGAGSNTDWLGYRVVSEDDLEDLAEKIVEEVKLRGPFRSMGEFVNRRLETGDLALRGALQAAIDRSNINEDLDRDRIDESDISDTDYANKAAITEISRHAGSPGFMLQADLLQSIGSVLQVRSDTFTIRAYGESSDGNSRAWCEAVVQRFPEWVDPADEPEVEFDQLQSPVNQAFGRRFEIISFRWLNPSEV
ncbi:MAG: hypothetical protein AAGI48_06410 [Verrucomicrobiota bacterium]